LKTRYQVDPTVLRAAAGVNDFGLRANGAASGADGLTTSLKPLRCLSSPFQKIATGAQLRRPRERGANASSSAATRSSAWRFETMDSK
jgi:hypothetical protein